MLHKKSIKVAALTTHPHVDIEVVHGGSTMTITLADVEGITAGVLTFEFAQKGSKLFEVPVSGPNTLDMAVLGDPGGEKSIAITDSSIGFIRVSLAGYAGTAAVIPLVVNTDDH